MGFFGGSSSLTAVAVVENLHSSRTVHRLHITSLRIKVLQTGTYTSWWLDNFIESYEKHCDGKLGWVMICRISSSWPRTTPPNHITFNLDHLTSTVPRKSSNLVTIPQSLTTTTLTTVTTNTLCRLTTTPYNPVHINISPDHITSTFTNTSHQINLKIKQSNGPARSPELHKPVTY